MSDLAIRFLHAADLHLERPAHGLAEVPDELRATLIDAPYRAAESLFDTAVVEQVDFIALAGDVLNPELAGPRGITFLLEQFERLHERGIHVYWAGGEADAPHRWPDAAKLPDNVHVFGTSRVEAITHYRDDVPAATILGHCCKERQMRVADFRHDGDLPVIAVAHGSADAASFSDDKVTYWALGGKHKHETICTSPCVAHYCGSPQGRSPAESGPHGCLLVELKQDGHTHAQFVATDVIRWHSERIKLNDSATREDLERQLGDRMLNLVTDASNRALLVSWKIEATGKLATELRQRGLADELTVWLRDEFADSKPAAWTISVEVEPPQRLRDSWYKEDTILGDFLRAVRECQADTTQSLPLESLLSQREISSTLGEVLQLNDPQRRERVLRDVAMLGADLLRGEDAA